MQALEIKKDIFWVGAVDYGSFDFHGYSLSPRGTTYNSYLVKDEKIVLFDTVKDSFASTMLCRLNQVLPQKKVDYLIINHVELDHAGAVPQIIAACKPEKIFCSQMALKSIAGHFDTSGWPPIQAVKTGDFISIGKRTIHFVEARMLHWPDSMLSYIPEDKLLITNDAFGQNIASTERFADEIQRPALYAAMQEYYYNIVLPYSQQVLKLLEQARAMKLDVDMIAPDHGLIYRTREDVEYVLNCYEEFALQKPKKRALIIYDTMWHSTEKMAYAVAEGLHAAGVPCRIMDLKRHHHSEVMSELANCGALLVGSPTHNNGILPFVAGTLAYIKGLRRKNLVGGAFGSFGWSGESVKIISEKLADMEVELPAEPVKCQFKPGHGAFEQCFALGKTIGAALAAKCA